MQRSTLCCVVRLVPLALGLAAASLGTAACSNHHGNDPAAASKFAVTVSGTVSGEGGAPLANATVLVGGQQTTTDAAGHYAATLQSNFAAETAVAASAPGYAPRSAVTTITGPAVGRDLVLRALGVTSSVALPSAAGGNVAVTLPGQNGNGSLTLVIPTGALAMANGTVANGNVDVSLTYWAAEDTFVTAPAPLWGRASKDAGAQIDAIVSFGMADIAITQGGQALQVAAGQRLTLLFGAQQADADYLATVATDATIGPRLWSADSNSGMWLLEGGLGDGHLSYDAANKVLVASLPHLSAWNVDSVSQTNGCVTGKLVDCSGNPLANTAASLWLMGKNSIGNYPMTSKADGTFCGAINGAAGDPTNIGQAYYFVSLANAPNSTICNPTGVGTITQLCGTAANGQPNTSTFCSRGNENGDESKASYAAGVKACGTPTIGVQMCGYCSGASKPASTCRSRASGTYGFVEGACTDLGTITLNTGACGSAAATPVDACKGKGDMTHQRCDTTADCCNQALECADSYCFVKTATN